ncbi:MAG: S8 family serine peptidase [Methanothrix sp.]|nr:S8 family serine peptidase [Methanothrix sp.]
MVIIFISGSAFATPWTPIEWQDGGKLTGWIRDQNGDFIDDLIGSSTGSVDLIVDLNQCIGDPAKSDLIRYLGTLGEVSHVDPYLTMVVVKGVDVNRTHEIASRPEVAMVELGTRGRFAAWGDNERAARIRHGAVSGDSLEEDFGWPGSLDGAGVHIAFLDTGISSGSDYSDHVDHGYDAVADSEVDPEPDEGAYHADSMAGWTLGIAPEARLIDIKIGGADGTYADAEIRAFRKVYEKAGEWDVDVVCLMYASDAPSDGRDARSQYIDMLSGRGISVVACAGSSDFDDDGTPVESVVPIPGAATRAIAVSTANICDDIPLGQACDSPERSDDTAPFVRGPRADDGDTDMLDELKPEVAMPTGERGLYNGGYPAAIGNSIATAMTAGLLALVLQYQPELADLENRASGSVKDILIRGAENKGSPDTSLAYPWSMPTWDDHWGFGEVDAYRTFMLLSGREEVGRTDLTFQGYGGEPHPGDPWYLSPAIRTENEVIESGVPNRIYANILNRGSTTAENVKISFGFYPFTAGISTFYDIGSVVEDIPPGVREVSIGWVPPDLPDGEDHGCIGVSIDYGMDTDFSGMSNYAQKNIRVEGYSSPAEFRFRVENPLPEAARIHLAVGSDWLDKGWKVDLSENDFVMEPHDCARTIKARVLPPAGASNDAIFFVTAYASPASGQGEPREIGGVALKAVPISSLGGPDLVVSSVEAGRPLVQQNGRLVSLPLNIVVRNTGGRIKDRFRVEVYVRDEKGIRLPASLAQSNGSLTGLFGSERLAAELDRGYVWLRGMDAGGEVAVKAQLVVGDRMSSRSLYGQKLSIDVKADGCEGEALGSYCRVKENDEKNNMMGTAVKVPLRASVLDLIRQ